MHFVDCQREDVLGQSRLLYSLGREVDETQAVAVRAGWRLGKGSRRVKDHNSKVELA